MWFAATMPRPRAGTLSRPSTLMRTGRFMTPPRTPLITRYAPGCTAGTALRPAPARLPPRVAETIEYASGPDSFPPAGYDPVNAKKRAVPSSGAAQGLPGRPDGSGLRRPLPAAHRDDPVGPVDRRDGQQGHARLFERYPTPEALAAADPADVEAIICPTGFFRQKTKSIIGDGAGDRSRLRRRGAADDRRAHHVARRRAEDRQRRPRQLLSAPESDHGIFVDTHIRRVSQRLALTDNEDPVKIEQDLMALLPKSAWVDVPHPLILLGRGPCNARNPDHDACPLLRWCPTGQAALAAAAPQPARRRAARGATRCPREAKASATNAVALPRQALGAHERDDVLTREPLELASDHVRTPPTTSTRRSRLRDSRPAISPSHSYAIAVLG